MNSEQVKERIEELIAKWHSMAVSLERIKGYTEAEAVRSCAIELEEVMEAEPFTEEDKDRRRIRDAAGICNDEPSWDEAMRASRDVQAEAKRVEETGE